ncbi:hypothetical protein BKA62DRAFT_315258 [Auriculariales sp. MPI-PUGE-AT-0066]|nr:hypothetical protein BKA62DRAFT_315258 [Auriculariales sp. MPI-PUGE-AT-0066]
MLFTFATTIALVGSAFAAPVPSSRYAALAQVEARSNTHVLAARYCSKMPSSVDPKIRDTIFKVVKQRTSDEKKLLVAMVTAYTESMVNNLDCGDKDSLGIYQQRPSQGWGNEQQLQTPSYAINKFMDALDNIWNSNSGKDAGVIAQVVQVAEAGNQYTKNLATAKKLVEQARASVGGDVGSGGDDNDDDSSSTTKTTKTSTKTKTTDEPAETSTAGNGGAINVPVPTETNTSAGSEQTGSDDGSDDTDCDDSLPACDAYYVPVLGDNCYKVAAANNIELASFYKLNPEIDEHCQNLYAGKQYCVAAADA